MNISSAVDFQKQNLKANVPSGFMALGNEAQLYNAFLFFAERPPGYDTAVITPASLQKGVVTTINGYRKLTGKDEIANSDDSEVNDTDLVNVANIYGTGFGYIYEKKRTEGLIASTAEQVMNFCIDCLGVKKTILSFLKWDYRKSSSSIKLKNYLSVLFDAIRNGSGPRGSIEWWQFKNYMKDKEGTFKLS
ncbi:MAG: hypothetical protein V4691_05090 [Pseudomonadota bacterium]